MLWQVRALLPDRPGAMAALASRCGTRGANILALDVHPTTDGQVVDELVIHAPTDWVIEDVERLCRDAGVADCVVTACSAHALEDQPVRYLRAAQLVHQQPDQLEDVLCQLLDAAPTPDVSSAGLLLDDDSGPLVALVRDRAFTATEEARVTELRLVAAAALGFDDAPSSARLPGEAVHDRGSARESTRTRTHHLGTLRAGTVADTRALIELHERCSAETLQQRYHSPMRHLSPRLAKAMLAPTDGFSIVVTGPEEHSVVGFGMAAFGEEMVEAAMLIEDRWQRQGFGAQLLIALAEEAARNGAAELTMLTRRDNTSVLATVRRAGLRAHVGTSDGLSRIRVPLRVLAEAPRNPGRASRGRITQPLVALLHQRQELREIYGPADLIDRAVRENV
jgi:GNAT superfamily N-acetyltransferase